MLKVSSILIGVNDLNKAKPFYEQVFGFQSKEFRPPFAFANFDSVEFNVEENVDYRAKDWADNYIGGRKHISFETHHLKQFLVKAEALGATIVELPQENPCGWKEAVIADPDGNEFIVEQKL